MDTIKACFFTLCIANMLRPSLGNLLVVTGGNYSIGPYDHTYWINSGPFFLHYNGTKLSTDSGTLKMENVSYGGSGIDKLGNWQDTRWNFYNPENSKFVAQIRTYPADQPNIVIFSQTFPQGMKKTGQPANANFTATGFPSFRIEEGATNDSLGFLQFAGYMLGDRSKVYGRWTPSTADLKGGLDGSGPLVLFDQQGGALLISFLDHSMAASMWLDDGVLSWGVMGGVGEIPPGFTLQTLLVYTDKGVGQAFKDWGRIMRQWHDKTEDVTRYHQSQDITLTHLGYWTDNGGYYYYHTEDGKNYEQTLPDVMKYASQQNIPYRYIQLDSWWYPKDNVGAVTTWDSMPSIFPHGLKNLAAALKMPIAAHNRYWSKNTTYAKQNGGQFDFFVGQYLSLPTGQAFWDWLLKTSAEWGLVLYEQDWLNIQTLGTELVQTNITAGADWLDSMARAARDNNMTIQYCMAQSRHALHSLRWPEVTQGRVTDDYQLYKYNWKIGVTSHLAAALGLAPSKDTFWTTSEQPGNPFNKSEPYPELQSVIATLSTGPVGPSDAINLTNRDNLMRCCADDGLILKPSRPATAIDAMFLEMAFGEGAGTSGEVWSTYTDFNDNLRYGIILAINVSRAFNITPTSAGFSPMVPQFPESRLFVRNSPEKVYKFSEADPFDIGPNTCDTTSSPLFCIFYTAPVFNVSGHEVILLGELDKWVPMSPQRVLDINLNPSSLTLTLGGQPGEKVKFSYLFNGQVKNQTLYPADPSGCVTIDIPNTPVPIPTQPTTHETTSNETDVTTKSSDVTTTSNDVTTTSNDVTTKSDDVTTETDSTENPVTGSESSASSEAPGPTKTHAAMEKNASPLQHSSRPRRAVYASRSSFHSERSCRITPPPFTPPPPSTTPSPTTQPPPTTEPQSSVTSPPKTTPTTPGGGASGVGVSFLSVVCVVLLRFVV